FSEMAQTLIAIVGFAALAAVCDAQCAAVDNKNCKEWVRNGFCTNPGYTLKHRQSFCPGWCANSGCRSTTTTTSATTKAEFIEHADCKKMSTDVKINFCGSAELKDGQKAFTCKTTCAADLAKADDCVFYTASATIERFKPSNRTAGAGTLVLTDLPAATTIKTVYVGPTCTLNLWNDPAAVPGTTAAIESLKGSPDSSFLNVNVATTAASFTCTCT
ncbi:hypothetical protein PFISCL1PPCAC_5191, partial [Pristionchus fissidentatus]